jgi:hypothetical protein
VEEPKVGAIKITDEMIHAGVRAFKEVRSLEYESAEEAVAGIIRAVLGSRVKLPDGPSET